MGWNAQRPRCIGDAFGIKLTAPVELNQHFKNAFALVSVFLCQ
jgi:hypothetical protein